MKSERALVELLARVFQKDAGDAPGVEVGIGDDCAVLAPARDRMVWTIDAQVDEVHFLREWLTYEDVGFRSFAAAASDVLAMGAAPTAALSALTLDSRVSAADVEALASGQRQASLVSGGPIVGGNLSRGATFSVTTTVLGVVLGAGAVTRSGARPGDVVVCSGPLGLARLGLRAFQSGLSNDPVLAQCVRAFRRPDVRSSTSAFVARAHAAIDVSDGLGLDVTRLAEASRVRVVLFEDAILSQGGHALKDGAARLGEDPVGCAIEGGEDYVVVLTCSPELTLPEGFRIVGRVEEGSGVVVDDGRGVWELEPGGHDHFAP